MDNKKIILGVTGGVACYKAVELASLLTKGGFVVCTVMTDNAKQFVTPVTFRAVTNNPVYDSLFIDAAQPIPHISLSDNALAYIVAPATANIIGKIAAGIADDIVTTSFMASKAPKIIVPAMNTDMWDNPIVQKNIEYLKSLGYIFVDPEVGHLACGKDGMGRYPKNTEIIDKLNSVLSIKKNNRLQGKRIIVTGGGTKEAIDPVRVITNRSSGKMGKALCKAAQAAGAEVIYIEADTVEGLKNNISKNYAKADVLIMAAAVSDYKPAVLLQSKMKTKNSENITLELVKTEDILAFFGKQKKTQYLVGFALESENLKENALQKIKSKNLDLIVANDVSALGADTSSVIIIDNGGGEQKYANLSKEIIAEKIIETICRDICR